MNSQQVMTAIRVAGFHEDTKTGTRLYIENRVSMKDYNIAFNDGRKIKERGGRCDCFECRRNSEKAGVL